MERQNKGSVVIRILAGALFLTAQVLPAAQQAVPATTEVQVAGESAAPKLDELAEVEVSGRRLAEAIAKAEEEFFSIFNELNKDDRYDTHCVYLQLDSDSRIQSRVCIPGFVADAMAEWAPFKARCQPPQENTYGPGGAEFSCLDRNHDGRLSLEEASARTELAAVFFDVDADHDFKLSPQEFPTDLPAPAIYQPPPPQLVLMEGSAAWYKHMTDVTNSDPRLKKMADHLGDMYYKLASAQREYSKMQDELRAQRLAERKCAGPTSPRMAAAPCKSN